jgi:hypothetical protein
MSRKSKHVVEVPKIFFESSEAIKLDGRSLELIGCKKVTREAVEFINKTTSLEILFLESDTIIVGYLREGLKVLWKPEYFKESTFQNFRTENGLLDVTKAKSIFDCSEKKTDSYGLDSFLLCSGICQTTHLEILDKGSFGEISFYDENFKNTKVIVSSKYVKLKVDDDIFINYDHMVFIAGIFVQLHNFTKLESFNANVCHRGSFVLPKTCKILEIPSLDDITKNTLKYVEHLKFSEFMHFTCKDVDIFKKMKNLKEIRHVNGKISPIAEERMDCKECSTDSQCMDCNYFNLFSCAKEQKFLVVPS